MELRTSEMVMFPRGCAHELARSPRGKVMPLETFLSQRNGIVDCNRKATTLICGQFNMDMHLALPALRALPEAVSLRARTEPGLSPLSDTLRLLRDEVETANFGNQIVVHNLLSSLFIYFMRDWAEQLYSPQPANWFSAVRSPHMARVLAQMHEAPDRPWTCPRRHQSHPRCASHSTVSTPKSTLAAKSSNWPPKLDSFELHSLRQGL